MHNFVHRQMRARLQLVDVSVLDTEQFDFEYKGRIGRNDGWVTSDA